MQELRELIDRERKTLVSKIILYAKIHNYMIYAPTQGEVWEIAVDGLADAFVLAMDKQRDIPPLDCFDDYAHDPMSTFGIQEAKKHRYRGIRMEVFMGLMKYFRRAFHDLVVDQRYDFSRERKYRDSISRFFDRLEIGFCLEWTRENKNDLVEELQASNRKLAFDNNKYQTIFESSPNPIIVLNPQHCIEGINTAALHLISPEDPKSKFINYYLGDQDLPGLEKMVPCLSEEFFSFISGYQHEVTIEKDILMSGQGEKNLEIRMIKLSNNVRKLGSVIMLRDMTERKRAEADLRYMSFHDGLTGLFNRAYFEQEMQRLENGRLDPVGIISFDLDGLKLVNDALGHQAGDALLIGAARTIHACFRENDVVARIGGDEFAVLLPNSPADVVESAAQRMREAVEKHNEDNPRVPLSISQGWAVRTDPAESLTKVYREADYQMYREKPWNREEFHQQFFRLYKEYGNDLYQVGLSGVK